MDINQEEWEARLESDLSLICRLCLKTSDTYHSIFNPHGQLQHKIMSIADISMFEGDGLPTHICNSCNMLVDKGYQFKLLCQRSDDKLRGTVVNIGDTEGGEDSHDIDMLTPQVIIDEDTSGENFQVETSHTKELIYKGIMTSVLNRSKSSNSPQSSPHGKPIHHISDQTNHQLRSTNKDQKPVYLNGLAGYVHSNQEMARMAVAMALHQKSLQEQKRKDLEKQKQFETGRQHKNDLQKLYNSNGNPEDLCESQKKTDNKPDLQDQSNVIQQSLVQKQQNKLIEFSKQADNLQKQHRTNGVIDQNNLSDNKSRRCRTGVKSYKCSQCNKCYSFSSALSRHKAVHNPHLRPHFCSMCNKGFTQMEKLIRHQRTHVMDTTVNINRFDVNSEEISIKPDLYYQSDSSEDPSNIPSDKSDEPLRTLDKPGEVKVVKSTPRLIRIEDFEKSNKMMPSASGKGKEDHRCTVCLKCFASRSSLEVHTNIHRDIRPFVCQFCQQSFRHKVNLLEHIQRKHSQVRPYQCDICAARFVTKQELLRHYRKHVS